MEVFVHRRTEFGFGGIATVYELFQSGRILGEGGVPGGTPRIFRGPEALQEAIRFAQSHGYEVHPCLHDVSTGYERIPQEFFGESSLRGKIRIKNTE